MGKLQRSGVQLREAVSEIAARHVDQGDPVDMTTVRILELRPELAPLVEEVEGLIAELQSHGVELKGLDLGLVDFPAEIGGEVVLLCWQFGESEVGYYHTLESGFAGRQPLDPTRVRPPRVLQ